MKSPANNLAAMLVRSARVFPNLPAVAVGTDAFYTYGEMARRVERIAAMLRESLEIGARVLIVSENSLRYLEALYACWHAGMIAVPVNAKLHEKEVIGIGEACGAEFFFTSQAWFDRLRATSDWSARYFGCVIGGVGHEAEAIEPFEKRAELPIEPVSLDDPAWLFFTSGTTGKPKAATLTHGNLRAMCLAFLADVLPVEPGDAMIHAAPLSHGSGLYALPHVMKAACNVVLSGGKFDPEETRELLHEWNGSCTFGPPTIINRVVELAENAPVDGLKSVIFAGAPLYVTDLARAWDALDGRVTQIYGQGESPCTITSMTQAMYEDALMFSDNRRLASVGVAQAGIEIKIAENGEVLVRGPTVMKGYWRSEVSTAFAFDSDQFLRTGDAGSLDPDGFLTLHDRIKDCIITGGSNVYPREVEEVLLKHPAVREVSVIGRPSAEWGEEIVACVVAKPDGLLDLADIRARLIEELDALCLANIARFKRPKEYVFLPSLPRSGYDKTLKSELRKLVTETTGSDA